MTLLGDTCSTTSTASISMADADLRRADMATDEAEAKEEAAKGEYHDTLPCRAMQVRADGRNMTDASGQCRAP